MTNGFQISGKGLDAEALGYMNEAVRIFSDFRDEEDIRKIKYDGRHSEGFYMSFTIIADNVDSSLSRSLSQIASKRINGYDDDTALNDSFRSRMVRIRVRPNLVRKDAK